MIIYLGLVNWIATTIFVDSFLFEDVRCLIQRSFKSKKIQYLPFCPMCMGTWIGIVEALIWGGPLHVGFLSFIANGLLYKSIGHLILQGSSIAHNTSERLKK